MEKVSKILNYLPQFWQKDEDSNNYKFILSISSDSDDIDINIVGLENGIQLNTATGVYLDAIGLLFRLYRTDGESDISFRARIKAYFQANLGGGSEPNMVTAIANSLGLSESDVDIITDEPNIFTLSITIGSSFDLSLLDNVSTIINNSKAAGMFYDTRKEDGGITINTENDYFLINISKINGEDKI